MPCLTLTTKHLHHTQCARLTCTPLFSPLSLLLSPSPPPLSADLDKVCDVKGDDDFRVFRYNEAKMLRWAKAKVHRLADALPDADVQVTAGSQSSNFVKRSRDKAGDHAGCLSFALGVYSPSA